MWILPHLEARSRSMKESEVREPSWSSPGCRSQRATSNWASTEELRVIGDLVYRTWKTVVEYEGEQHQGDRSQYSSDIERYELFRDHDMSYVQVTKERLGRPRDSCSGRAHLRRNGYDGPAPIFGERWRLLFGSLYSAVGPRDHGRVAG